MPQNNFEKIKNYFQPKLSNFVNISFRIISILVLGYLFFIPAKGLEKNRRLDTTEV